MVSLRLGSRLEATPAYQKAVAAQRAKKEERRAIEAKRLEEAERAKQQLLVDAVRYKFPPMPVLVEDAVKPAPIDIIAAIAHQCGYSLKDIRGTGRSFRLVKCRHRAMAEVKRLHPMISTPRLGQLFHRDHSSIVTALKNIDRPRVYETHRIAPETVRRAKALRMEGHTHRYISEQVGISPWMVSRLFIRERIQ